MMEIYQELHKWEDMLRVAEVSNSEDIDTLKTVYYNWLLSSNQDSKAADIK